MCNHVFRNERTNIGVVLPMLRSHWRTAGPRRERQRQDVAARRADDATVDQPAVQSAKRQIIVRLFVPSQLQISLWGRTVKHKLKRN